MLPGHVVLDQQGAIVEADDGFETLLMSSVADLRGRNVLSFTAPADRDECTRAIAGLRTTGRPFDITKRFIRQDDSTLWVRNSVSRMTIQRTELIVATCTPVLPDVHRRTPGALLNSAHFHAAMARGRNSVGDPLLLSGASWPLLLEVYIAEAEGRAVSAISLADHLGQSKEASQRWINVLISSDVLEVELGSLAPDVSKTYRLTSSAVQRLEEYLDTYSGLLSGGARRTS
jgi:PAS domain S-box-containing protein